MSVVIIIFIGCGISDLEEILETGQKIKDGQARKVSPYFVPKILTNVPSWYISKKYFQYNLNI